MNLHNFTLTSYISEAISTLGHLVIKISNTSKQDGALHVVDLKLDQNNNEIFNIFSLLNTVIKTKSPCDVK
jgi:hypothetical protein